MSAAVHLGQLPEAGLQSELARTVRQQQRNAQFGAAANLLFGAPDGLYQAIPDETPVCRCEEVTAGQVRAAVSSGVRSLDGLKPAVRVGQGLCQGRTCGPTLARMMAVSTGDTPAAGGLFRARPPLRPVSLAEVTGLRHGQNGSATQFGESLQEEGLR